MATVELTDLVKQYPNSTAAIMANQKLKAMGTVKN